MAVTTYDQKEVAMKTVRISSAVNYVKSVAIMMVLSGFLVFSVAPTASAQIGWAVGDGGTIIATANGGTAWGAQTSPIPGVKLNSVFSRGGGIAWAVGDTNTAGGAASSTILFGSGTPTSWVAATGPIQAVANLNGVYFADGDHGWAVGDVAGEGNKRVSTILASVNDGRGAWNQELPRDGGNNLIKQSLKGVFFTDKDHGWAVGDNGTIVNRNNGNWTLVPNIPVGLNFTSVTGYIDPNTRLAVRHFVVYAVATNGQIWFSQDNGRWAQLTNKKGMPINGEQIKVAFATSATEFWIGQAVNNPDVQYVHKNGPNPLHSNWLAPVKVNDRGFNSVSGLSGTDSRHIWIVGDDGLIDYRNGSASRWIPQYTPADDPVPLNSIVMTGTGGPGGLVQLEGASPSDSVGGGMTYVSLTGSGFPEGNINPANVVVELAAECRGTAGASTSAVSVVSASSDRNLISFLLPGGLAPGQYFISISDSEEGDANFESSNCSEVNITQ
jgi:photosystem II stability/assembly factor-like uncharacterized protein